jgi:four helix bundle protein
VLRLRSFGFTLRDPDPSRLGRKIVFTAIRVALVTSVTGFKANARYPAGMERIVKDSYEDLKVWRLAMDLVLNVYRCTASFPKQEMYGLTSQMRRAAVSIPSNIAEGKGRYSRKELVQFLFHARGSLLELRTQMTIARELGFLEQSEADLLIRRMSEVGRLLNGLINHFQSTNQFPQPNPEPKT